ncbi:MAG: Phosphoribosyl pyrophosphate synthase [Lachnoclostridium sp.]|jgi:ribose-phosphate pyrophosphokinase
MTTTHVPDAIPVAPLKIMALDSFRPMAEKIDSLIVNARRNPNLAYKNSPAFMGYEADSYLVNAECPRFTSGEAKGLIHESIHGTDLFILADITNYSNLYQMHGKENKMSPDDHFQDLKRLIDACNGKAHRINVIIPFLYEGRQNKRTRLESLDCATALQELVKMGVKNIITFDALDPRVVNAIPTAGFDNFYTSYQFIQSLLTTEKDLRLDSSHLMIISPDESVMSKAVFYTNILGVDLGMFYKKYDYSRDPDLNNEPVSYEYLGADVAGKDMVILTNTIFTGRTILTIAKELKKRKAARIFVIATFGLFIDGYEKFDKYYKEGIIDRVFTTNLIYCSNELMEKPYYTNVDLSRYLARIIHTINHDQSVDSILDSTTLIQDVVDDYKKKNM